MVSMDFEHLPHAELVAAYLDGEASPDERALVERLLAEQPEYQQFAAEWQSLTGSLSALPKRRLEVDLSSAVLSAIAQRAPLVAPPEIAVQAEIAPTVALDRTRDAGALPLVAPAGGSVHASGEAAARDAAAEKTSATVAPSEDDSARPGDADWFERLPLATAPRTGMRLRWWTIGLVVSAAAVVLLMLAAPDGPLTPSQLSLQFDHGGGERVTTQSGAAPSGAVERAPTSSAPSPNFAPVPATKDELGRPFAGEAESVRQMDLLREEDADHTAVAPAEKQQESADKQEAADKGGMRKALPSDVNRRGGVRRSAGENARPDGFDAAPGAGDAVDQPVPAAPLQRPSRPAPTSQPAPAMAPASMGEPASGPAPPAVPRPTPEPPTTTAAGAKSPAAAPLAPPLPAPPGPRGMNRENAETRQQTEAETAAETMEKRSPSPKGAFRDPARPDAPRGPGAFGGVGGGAGAAMPGRPVELQAPAPSGAPASAAPSPSGDARERDFKGEAAKFGEAAKKEAAKQEANGTAAGASADRDAATSRWTAPTSDVAGQSEPGDSAATRKKLENGSDKLNRGT
ncbi:MAG TPA: hypothetical protein VGE52_09830, partial [Pirellulales bacterium]